MTKIIDIDVLGDPVGKGRGRAVNTASGTRVVTPSATRKWEAEARAIARQRMGDEPPWAGPVTVQVWAYSCPPKSWAKWKQEAALAGALPVTSRPDLDNVVKAALDAINGVVFRDDAQVYQVDARKAYGEKPRVFIRVEFIHETTRELWTRIKPLL